MILQKFATTFIKSTKLPYKELYDYPDAARFVADHLLYQLSLLQIIIISLLFLFYYFKICSSL